VKLFSLRRHWKLCSNKRTEDRVTVKRGDCGMWDEWGERLLRIAGEPVAGERVAG